jgi:NADPH-dependent curcumin reductase CurA
MPAAKRIRMHCLVKFKLHEHIRRGFQEALQGSIGLLRGSNFGNLVVCVANG